MRTYARTLSLLGFTAVTAFAMKALQPNVGPVIYAWFGVATLFGLLATVVSLIHKDFRHVGPWLWTTFGFTAFAILIAMLFGSPSSLAVIAMLVIGVAGVVVSVMVCFYHDIFNRPILAHGSDI